MDTLMAFDKVLVDRFVDDRHALTDINHRVCVRCGIQGGITTYYGSTGNSGVHYQCGEDGCGARWMLVWMFKGMVTYRFMELPDE